MGDPEVRQPGRAVGRQEDVAGLHVAVDDPGLVGRGEGGCDVRRNGDGFGFGHRRTVGQAGGERRAGDVVEDQCGLVVGDVEVADADDVRVMERLERPKLTFEPPPSVLRTEHDGMQPLEGDLLAGLLVDRAPDLGRPAGPGGREQAVAAEQHGVSHAAEAALIGERTAGTGAGVSLRRGDG